MFGKKQESSEPDDISNEVDENSFVIDDTPLPDHPSVPKDLKFMLPAVARATATTAIASGTIPRDIVVDLSGRNDDIGRIARTVMRATNIAGSIASGNVNDVLDAAINAATMAAEVKAEVIARGIKNPFSIKGNPDGPGGGVPDGGSGDGGFTIRDGGGYGHHYHGSLSMEPEPFIEDFRTDIRQMFFCPNYQKSEESYALTLLATAVDIKIPTVSSTALGAFTYQVIADIRNQVARNINISTSLSSLLSTTNLIDYFNNVLLLLAQYYAMKRILSWAEPKPILRNDGLYAIRTSMTADVLQRYLSAERCLAGLPIPPNMNLFCSWLYQLHASGPIPMSPVLMIDPFSMTNGVYNWSEITNTVSAFNVDSAINVANVLARAFPNWENPKLFTPAKLPMYGAGFNTIWKNLPFYATGSTPVAHNVLGPSITNISDTVRYNCYQDDLDGCAWALFGSYVTGLSSWIPTLVTPNTVSTTLTATNVTNRYHYGTVGGVAGFYDSYNGNPALLARDETYTINNAFVSTPVTAQISGSQRIDFVDPQTCIESARAFVDWLMTWESINVRVDRSLQNKRPPRKNRFTSNKKKG